MKKALLFTALLVAAGGSWAFQPKTDGPAGYMMVINSVAGAGFSGVAASITIVAPDGTQKQQPVEFKRGSAKKAAENLEEMHVATLGVINEYAHSGWHVVSATPTTLTSSGGTIVYQTVYLLGK